MLMFSLLTLMAYSTLLIEYPLYCILHRRQKMKV